MLHAHPTLNRCPNSDSYALERNRSLISGRYGSEMLIRRATRVIAVLTAAMALAVACAPGPNIAEPTEPTTSTTTSWAPNTATTTLPPGLDRLPPTMGGDPIDPENLSSTDGRIATHRGTAQIRTGDETLPLTTGDIPSQPTWSRAGERLAVVSLQGREVQVDVFDSGGQLIQTNPAPRPYFFFSWSYDGTRIAALGPGADGTTLDLLDSNGALLHESVAEAGSLWVAWDPASPRLVAHADERLLRIDPDAISADLGSVGLNFFVAKWIPNSNEVLLVVDIEGSPLLVRRSIEGGDTLTTLGDVEGEIRISVNPDGRTAALSREGEPEGGGGGGGERTALGLAQTDEPSRAGDVQIVDLESGQRTTVFNQAIGWAEWNAQGTRLLMSTTDLVTGESAWWIYEPDDSDLANTFQVTTFVATPTFFGSYLQFSDQFIETPRLWSPTGDTFVFSDLTVDGAVVRTAPAVADAETADVSRGEVGFWSPAP